MKEVELFNKTLARI